MREEEEQERPRSLCEHRQWRRSSPGWKQEDDPEGWSIHRQYRREQCVVCKATRLIHALDRRRRYHLHHQDANHPAFLKHLTAKQWRTIADLIAQMKRNRFEVQALLTAWAEAGWVELEERWIASTWQLERARLSPLIVDQKKEQQARSREEHMQQATESLLNALHQWRVIYQEAARKHYAEHDLKAVLSRLSALFEEQESALARGVVVPPLGTTLQAGEAPHRRWMAILRGILDLLAHPRVEHERIFSARWLHDSKALRKERDALEAFLSIEGGLERLGLVKHTPIVLSWGAWQARWNDFVFDGRAGFSFTAIPADLIPRLIQMQVEAETLLIVENQTPFEILVQPERRDPCTLYLWGAGLPGQAQRELAALWLRARPTMNWSAWTDYDPGGVAIQRFWHDWSIQEQLAAPHPYRWMREDLAQCQTQGVPLSVEQREHLARIHDPLAQLLLEGGHAIEQEAILAAYEFW
jgi:hypothetical protein